MVSNILSKKLFIRLFTFFVVLLASAMSSAAVGDGWQPLIGSNLKGWQKEGGEADIRLDGKEIVGTSKLKTPNSFLVTKKKYSDFILEYEVKIADGLNSGVQIRSALKKGKGGKGRVYGYQVELDPTSRNFTGGIFDEARRKWIYPMVLNPKAQSAFRPGEWNKFRVQAVGNTLQTWVNGVMCAWLADSLDSSGFIGLQVHSIKRQDQVNKQVRWRNIRIKTQDLSSSLWPADSSVFQNSYLVNRLTGNEQRLGYKLLWDGKTNEGWRGAKIKHFPKSGWVMKDGVLTVLKTDGGESTGPGDIITKERFSSFDLQVDFKLTPGANSGIKYLVDPELNKGAGSAIGLEFQLLDNKLHPDAKQGVLGNRTLASAYDLITAQNLSEPRRSIGRTFNGIGEWNRARVIVRDGAVEHWLNNFKVVEFNRFSQIFGALVNYSKYQKWPDFGQLKEGHILLQDHGDTVHFRSIKIRKL